MSSPIITVENLGKKYHIRHNSERVHYKTLRESLSHASGQVLARLGVGGTNRTEQSSPSNEEFWALRNVSFEIRPGEVVGFIGRNGAGKSTLLKILSRITEPTTGSVRLRGRVASLLEVGTGFHPELTGRENIYLNGAILGMSRTDIKRRFDEIVAFAEVEQFLDTPVKRYSSGMYVRLAFAVAAHLEPEILVVDEVLAVGDAEFQKKCLGKMESVSRESGRTILFVSHNMAAVRALCSRAILLRKGSLTADGMPDEQIESYLGGEGASAMSSWERPPDMACVPPLHFKAVESRLRGRQPRLQWEIDATLECVVSDCPKVFVAVDVSDVLGVALMQAEPYGEPFMELQEGTYKLRLQIDLPPLIPGRYTADIWVGPHRQSTLDWVRNVVAVTIDESPTSGRNFPHTVDHGHVVPPSRCQYEFVEVRPTTCHPEDSVCV